MAKLTCVAKLAVSLAIVATAMVVIPVPASAAKAPAKSTTSKTSKQAKPGVKAPVRSTAKKSTYSATSARARRAQLANARAAARAREMRDVQTPRFRVDEFGREVPDVRAEAALVYDPTTGEVLWENHAQDQRSMASITKVMTALVFLESGAPMSTPVTVQRSDVSRASTTYLRTGFKLTADDLLNLLLLRRASALEVRLVQVWCCRANQTVP